MLSLLVRSSRRYAASSSGYVRRSQHFPSALTTGGELYNFQTKRSFVFRRRPRKKKAVITIEEKTANEDIKPLSGKVRLVDKYGVNRGVVTVKYALEKAASSGLDLVQMTKVDASDAEATPVCKILDYGRYLYDLRRKEEDKVASAKATAKANELKEIHVGTSIGEHDLQFKLDRVKEFLEKGFPVRIVVKFRRSRELPHHLREPRALEIIRNAGEYLNGLGKEMVSSRKINAGSVRTVFQKEV